MNLLEDRGLREFGGGVAEDSLVSRAVVEAAPLRVDQRDHVGGIFGNDAEQGLPRFGPPVGDINPDCLRGDDEQG